MALSKHNISAWVVDPFYDLAVLDAAVTLDEEWSPYARVTLTCWLDTEEEGFFEAIDPRDGLRVGLNLERITSLPSVRTFDLALRERIVDHSTGTMVLTLAGDEALLQDKALVSLTSDRIYGLSAKDAVEFALDSIGAVLEAGAADADVEANEAEPVVTNLVRNPRVGTNTTDWTHSGAGATATRETSGGPAEAPTFWRSTMTTSNPSPFYIYVEHTGCAVLPSTRYKVSSWVRCSVSTAVRLSANTYSAATVAGGVSVSEDTILEAGVWTRLTADMSTDVNAAKVRLHVLTISGTLVSGDTFDNTGWMVAEASDQPDYFDGGTADTGLYTYAWTGTAHASTSTKTWIPNADIMVWEPGVSAWDYIEPIVKSVNLRLWCDEERNWYLEEPNVIRDGQINISATVNATQASDSISLLGDQWYDSVVLRYAWTAEGLSQVAYDIAGAPGSKTRFLTLERPFAGAGLAQNLLDAATGRGRTLDLSAISQYEATPGMPLVATLPDTITQTGFISSVTWSFPDDEMSIESRDSIDTPPESWIFTAAGIAWNEIAVGTDWTEYTA